MLAAFAEAQERAGAGCEVHVFGYGSLIWSPDFEFAGRWAATCRGFKRRFSQLSPDHRGTHELLGRTVVLLEDEGGKGVCGEVYLLPAAQACTIMTRLIHRERAGYDAISVSVDCNDGVTRQAWTFARATPPGPEADPATFYAGEEEATVTARVIAVAAGRSGTNLQYFVRLLLAMRQRRHVDEHLERLWTHVLLERPDSQAVYEEEERALAAAGSLGGTEAEEATVVTSQAHSLSP